MLTATKANTATQISRIFIDLFKSVQQRQRLLQSLADPGSSVNDGHCTRGGIDTCRNLFHRYSLSLSFDSKTKAFYLSIVDGSLLMTSHHFFDFFRLIMHTEAVDNRSAGFIHTEQLNLCTFAAELNHHLIQCRY